MVQYDPTYSQPVLPDTPEFANRFFCKLFDDMVIRSTCILRRRELNDTKQFTCKGCSKDRIITAISSRRSGIFGAMQS